MKHLQYLAPIHVAIAFAFQTIVLGLHAPLAAVWGPIVVLALFFGREESEAEYRWMALHNTNRAGMPRWAAFTWDAWRTSPKSFGDFLLPALAAAALAHFAPLIPFLH